MPLKLVYLDNLSWGSLPKKCKKPLKHKYSLSCLATADVQQAKFCNNRWLVSRTWELEEIPANLVE